MKPLIIIGIILVILFLLAQIRVGGSAEYSSDGFTAEAVIACFRITLFPRPKLTPLEREQKAAAKEKKESAKKSKKDKAEKKRGKRNSHSDKAVSSENKKQKLGGTIDLILKLLPVLGKFLAGLGKKIRVDRLNINLSVGGGDAAAVAITYGQISSIGPYIVRWAEENMDLHEHHVQVSPDFLSGSTTIAVQAKLTYTIGQLIHIVLKTAFSALAVFLKYKLKRKNK